MEKLKFNYHTHNKLCNHAEGHAEDYIKEAVELGMDEIGISDHTPLDRSFMSKEDFKTTWASRNMSLEQYHNIYIPELIEAKKKYETDISIKFGLECEYLEGHDDFYKNFFSNVDYLNVGIHFYESNGVILNTYLDLNYTNIDTYATACVKAMESGLFTILCHPDLFMWAYKNENGTREFDSQTLLASKRIIESAIKTDTILEINANGVLNSERFAGPNVLLYPNSNFWELASTYENLKVTIGADCHRPADLSGYHIEKCFELAKKYNIKLVDKVVLKQPVIE